MRRLAPLALLLFPLPARADGFDPKPIDAVVERAMDEFRVPGAAVVIVKDDEVVYLKGFGTRKQGGTAKVTPDTVFPIASCSKAFTATLAAMLADEGTLGLDDPVRKHLDFFRLSDELADRDVTVRDLLCHRTGMPRHDWLWSAASTDTEDVIRRFGRARPSTSFRSAWEYSNVPFTTAGLLAGRAAKSSWADLTKKRIFAPLGMTASSCTHDEGTSAENHATPHYLGFDKSIRPVKWDDIDHAGGAGCVNSTARDMGHWLRLQLADGEFDGKRVVSRKMLKETHSPQMVIKPEGPWAAYFPARASKFVSYGLGWFVHDYRGHLAVSHGGTLTGFRAQCMLVPEKGVGVFVVGNLRPSYFTEAVAKTVLDQLLGLPAEDWVAFGKEAFEKMEFQVAVGRKKREAGRKPDTKPSLEPAKYAGAYRESAYGKLTVSADDGELLLKWGKLTFRLEHFHHDTFSAVPVGPKDDIVSLDRSTLEALFRLGSDGEVEWLRFLDQEFRRDRPKG